MWTPAADDTTYGRDDKSSICCNGVPTVDNIMIIIIITIVYTVLVQYSMIIILL